MGSSEPPSRYIQIVLAVMQTSVKGIAIGVSGLMLGATVSAWCGTRTQEDPSFAYLACKGTHGLFACDAYARRQGAVIYTRPDTRSETVKRKEYGMGLGLLEPGAKLAMAEWLPVYMVVEGPDGRLTKEMTAYVRRADVILNTDFRRVTGCWPLKRVVIPYSEQEKERLEDHGDRIYFNTKGVACDSLDQHECAKYLPGNQHTYYAEGVFIVPHEKSVRWTYIGSATVDYATHTATYQGAKPFKDVEWFTPEELKGCTKIPVTDDVRPPTPREID